MADISESTALLASNDHPDDTNARNDSEDEIPTMTLPANAHFKRPIKILTICVSTASVLGAIFLTASFIIVHLAPFTGYTYNTPYVLQELGTCVFISFVLSTFMIFFQFPIIVSLLINLIFTTLAFLYTGNVFGRGWPDDSWCYTYRYPDYPDYPDTQCRQWRMVARTLISIGGGLGFLVGLFYLVLVLLRVVAISRAKFWKRNGMCPSYPSGHYTFQITLGFLKKSQRNTNGENENAREESWSDSVEGRLIDA